MTEMTTEQLLAERGTTHGEYTDHARCTQTIMRAVMAEKNWDSLPDIMKESLHMFAHKMGRVATGNPNIHDHWDDIAGYAKLVSQRIGKPVEKKLVATYTPGPRQAQAAHADSEAQAMFKHTERNILSGKAMQVGDAVVATEVAEPFGYEVEREVSVGVRKPIHVRRADAEDQKDGWSGEQIMTGSMKGNLWRDLYMTIPTTGDLKMIYAHQTEYGKEV